MSTHTNTNNVQKNKRFLKWFGIGILAVVALIVIAGIAGGGDEEVKQQEATTPLEAIEQHTAVNEDTTVQAHVDGISLNIEVDLPTTLPQSMLATTAQQHTTRALEAVQQHGDSIDQDWERIIVRGHQEDREIMSPVYQSDTLQGVDLEDHQGAAIFDLRDTGMVHPDLTE